MQRGTVSVNLSPATAKGNKTPGSERYEQAVYAVASDGRLVVSGPESEATYAAGAWVMVEHHAPSAGQHDAVFSGTAE